MHFKGFCLLILALFVLCLAYTAFSLGQYDAEDQEEYERLIRGGTGENAVAYTSRQERQGLQKDIYFKEKEQQLQLRIHSRSAELIFDRQDSGAEIIEKMQQVACWMQEELLYITPDGREVLLQNDGRYLVKDADPQAPSSWLAAGSLEITPMQRIAFLEADHASYSYNKEHFYAENVKISQYLAATHQFENASVSVKPLSSGRAQNLEFSFSSQGIDVKAKDLKASFTLDGDPLSVAAAQAECTGQKVAFHGNVLVEHPLGTIYAQSIALLRTSEANNAFGLIQIQDNVQISFSEGGILSCSQAILDCRALKGEFLANEDPNDVVYSENIREKKQRQTPISLSSRRMTCTLVKDPSEKYRIDTLTADTQVSVEYDREFIAKSDSAVYKRHPGDSMDPFKGLLVLKPSPGASCQITRSSGDLIRALQIDIDTLSRQMVLKMPRGTFYPLAGPSGPGQIDFSANWLVWDEPGGVLTLREGIKVDHKEMGQLQTSREMRLYQHLEAGQRTLRTLETDGDTVVTYWDPDLHLVHMLTCYGPLCIDHEKREMRLSSPGDADGAILEDKQIFFQDAKGEIYANAAHLQYSLVEGRCVPAKLTLTGNVRVFNHEEAEAIQYALADRVEFSPQDKEMLFKAAPKQRILFFDPSRHLEVSAPALKIKRDLATNQESIEGIGDVRFSFIEPEIEQLRRKFSLEKFEKEMRSSHEP